MKPIFHKDGGRGPTGFYVTAHFDSESITYAADNKRHAYLMARLAWAEPGFWRIKSLKEPSA